MIEGLTKIGYPIKPVPCESGYFVMADVSEMKDLIPKKYLETHDFEEDSATSTIVKNKNFNPDGSIPLDLAVCRWMALEK